MCFKKHPSQKLCKLFKEKPFQGQNPEKAKIIFLNSDANYSKEITNHKEFFNKIIEYHEDGMKFWKNYEVHHPFLKDYPYDKRRGGVPFHRNFSKLGLDSKYASHICFLELLDIPTMGNKSENLSLFNEMMSKNKDHLKRIDKLLTSSSDKLIFISSGVIRNVRKLQKDYQVFSDLDLTSLNQTGSLKIGKNKIKKIYHFSSYKIHGQISTIKKEMNSWLKK